MYYDEQKTSEIPNQKDIVAQVQIGYKPNARTSDHIFTVKTLVNKYVNDQKNKKLYACVIDYKKAFDSVPQELLYTQLLNRNINGRFLSLLKNIKFENCRTKF